MKKTTKKELGLYLKKSFTVLWRFVQINCLLTGFLVWGSIIIFLVSYSFLIFSLPNIEKMNFEDLKRKSATYITSTSPPMEKSHEWISLDRISNELSQSIVSGEDSMFFSHNGIDIPALLIAFGENLRMHDKILGASTISQQVTKNLFLSREKTYIRKLKEIYLTRNLENKFTKNQILEIYLNIAEFGPNIFGVEEASEYYFKKPASHINAAEGAFIAIMLPAPVTYNKSVFKNKNLSARHRNKIMRILKELKYKKIISNSEYSVYENYRYFDEN